jgi:hypothetical protein
MKPNSISREMDNVSRLFMSSSDDGNEAENSQSFIEELPLDNREEDVEIEEKVSVQKKIAYPNDHNAQTNMQQRLQTLVREGYKISRIELKKNRNIEKPGRKETREEQVILFLKESGAE